jgi:Ni,Fe-hydrogenase maturation factor
MQTVIGIGSDHGVDAIGWRVVERLRTKGLFDTNLVLAREPSDILRFCDDAKVLHLVDACIGPETGRLHTIDWPDPQLAKLPWKTTHGIDVPGALELGAVLGVLPAAVTIWCIEFDPSNFAPCSFNTYDLKPTRWGEFNAALESVAEAISTKIAMMDSK